MSRQAIQSMILRGKVTASTVNGRTLLQVQVLDEDAHDLVELLLPPGFVGSPITGADVLEMQIGGNASHKVILGGDHTMDALADLQPGESGLSRGGQQLIQRLTGTEIVSTLLRWGSVRAALQRLVQEEFMALYNAHEHPTPSGLSGPPTVPMTEAQLTGNL